MAVIDGLASGQVAYYFQVHHAVLDGQAGVRLSQALFDLTPTQARVAAGLAQGRTVDELATASGTQVSTVRTHLAAVLQRVGASRGDDLVRRLHDGHLLWGAAPGG